MATVHPDLLPGVEPPRRPSVDGDTVARELARARQRAAVEDLLDCAVLIVVDLLFLLWPNAQVPFLDRDATLTLLLLANVVTVAGYVWTRALPVWKARRIAMTWSAAERARFSARQR
ncbi:MAG TPA: hypothetical protein VGF40_01810 [Thermoanaerobaculia bacterium]